MMKYFNGAVEFSRRAAALQQAERSNVAAGRDVSDVAVLRRT